MPRLIGLLPDSSRIQQPPGRQHPAGTLVGLLVKIVPALTASLCSVRNVSQRPRNVAASKAVNDGLKTPAAGLAAGRHFQQVA